MKTVKVEGKEVSLRKVYWWSLSFKITNDIYYIISTKTNKCGKYFYKILPLPNLNINFVENHKNPFRSKTQEKSRMPPDNQSFKMQIIHEFFSLC